MKPKLETLANIAILLLCVIAIATLIRKNFFTPTLPSAPPPTVRQGEVVEVLQPFIPPQGEKTLFLVLAPDCRFCSESMGFYSRLGKNRAAGVNVIVAVDSEDELEAERFQLLTSGVEFDELVPIDHRLLPVPGTPSLLLVNRRSEVLDIWIGKLDEQTEAEILEALGAA